MVFQESGNNSIMENQKWWLLMMSRRELSIQNSRTKSLLNVKLWESLVKEKEVHQKWKLTIPTGINETLLLEINSQVDMVKKEFYPFFGLRRICLLQSKE